MKSPLNNFTDAELTRLARILNPIADRAAEIGLKPAISERWDQCDRDARLEAINCIDCAIRGDLPTAADHANTSNHLATVMIALVLNSIGWQGERIEERAA